MGTLVSTDIKANNLEWYLVDEIEHTSAASTIEFALPDFSIYDMVKVVITELTIDTSSVIVGLNASPNGGTTWRASAGDYRIIGTDEGTDIGGTAFDFNANATSAIYVDLIKEMGNNAAASLNSTVIITHWGSSAWNTQYRVDSNGYKDTDIMKMYFASAESADIESHNRARITVTSGNIDTAYIKVYAQRRARSVAEGGPIPKARIVYA